MVTNGGVCVCVCESDAGPVVAVTRFAVYNDFLSALFRRLLLS